MTDPIDIPALRPCPFCGQEPDFGPAENDPGWWLIRCSNPECFVELEVQCEGEDNAAERWNRRQRP